MRTTFEQRLEGLEAKLLQMGQLVQSQLDRTLEALASFDTTLADEVIVRDDQIDRTRDLLTGLTGIALPAAQTTTSVGEEVRCTAPITWASEGRSAFVAAIAFSAAFIALRSARAAARCTRSR